MDSLSLGASLIIPVKLRFELAIAKIQSTSPRAPGYIPENAT
jgi:hypothetical protein